VNPVFRPLHDSDHSILNQWIALDPDHSAKGMTSEFFFRPGGLSFAIEDSKGPTMFLRLEPELPISARIHIQFLADNESRTARSLHKAFPTVRGQIEKAGLKRMVFESISPKLSEFCKRCFGFTEVPGTTDFELFLGSPQCNS